jgi:RNA polymerase sigma factor (TIGR02999 family)
MAGDVAPLGQVTAQLRAASDGDLAALAGAFSRLYARLRGVAERAMAQERPDHTLEAQALVAEAWLRLRDQRGIRWRSRQHFVAVAARIMRRILIDHARGRATSKRSPGEGAQPTSTADPLSALVAAHEALEALERESPGHRTVVEFRLIGGFTNEEIAAHLGVSLPTVERRWRLARAWMFRYLSSPES